MERKVKKGTAQVVKSWKNLDRIWNELLPKHTERGFAALLVGPSEQAQPKALSLASEKSSNVFVVRPGESRSDRLRGRIDDWLGKEDALFERVDLPVLVVLGLDDFKESVQVSLKGMLETRRKRWICLATCENPDAVPAYLSSMFYIVRGLLRPGRRRKGT